MNCAEWEERLNAALDGELSDVDRALLDAHLAACADCRRTRDAIGAQSAELERLRFESKGLEERIIATVHAETSPRKGGFRILIVLAAAAVILLGYLLFVAPEEHAMQMPLPEMVLQCATGPVEERIGELWVPFSPGDSVRPGMQLRTGESSRCEISFRDGSLLRLDSATQVRFQDPRTIHLAEGELFARVAAAPAPFRFTTEDGGLQAEGGILDLSYRRSTKVSSKFNPPPLGTSLAVLEGKAMIGELDVPAPSSCTMLDKIPGTPEPVDSLLRTRWVHDLLKLKDRNDPETAARVTALLTRMGRTQRPDLYEREIRGLGEHGAPALLALVAKLPDDLSASDRRQAARLLSDLAGPSEVEALIKLLRDGDGELRTAANRALIRITGADLKSPDAWETWFQENGDLWGVRKPHR